MLLYARVAPTKTPKKRSRAGCTLCKEKKKKCDESRPTCGRCVDLGKECTYEAVRPRQRRKMFSPEDAFDDEDSPEDEKSVLPDRTLPRVVSHSTQGLGERCRSNFSSKPAGPPCFYDSDDTIWLAQGLDCYYPSPAKEDYDNGGVEDIQIEDLQECAPNLRAEPPTAAGESMELMLTHSTSPRFELHMPAFSEFSPLKSKRVLMDYFCNVLSHLIVLREEDGNPFQHLVLPLSVNNSAVVSAIYALASAHLEARGGMHEANSLFFHNEAIRSLAKLIDQGHGANKNELLATIILLVYYEVLVQRGRSNIVHGHLKGAMAIMKHGPGLTDPTSVFLERAFRFYDVITALSFGTATLSPPPAVGDSFDNAFFPVDAHGGIRPTGSADVLLGMATTLWPIIHRLSDLRGLKNELRTATAATGDLAELARLSTELQGMAAGVEHDLQEWQPFTNCGGGLTTTALVQHTPEASQHIISQALLAQGPTQGILNNALAYRHSAIVFLYRSIYGVWREHDVVQHHTHVALCHCVGTVESEGPMGALLWPLFVAACEAKSDEDRDLARQSFAGIIRRQGMTNIERAWCVVQEVWRRADKSAAAAAAVDDLLRENGQQVWQDEELPQAESGMDAAAYAWSSGDEDLWRQVSQEMGYTIVFG